MPESSDSTSSTSSSSRAAAQVWDWRGRDSARRATEANAAAHARKRGAIGLVVGLAVAAGLYFLLHRPLFAEVVAGIAIILALLAFAFPRTLYRQVMKGFDLFGYGVGTLVTWVLMTLLFYLLFLPFGLLLRAGHKLRIARHTDPRRPTYWQEPKARPATVESYQRQF